MFNVSLIIHIIAGFLALCLLIVPLVTKKGGKVHRKVGWIYVWAMGTVAVTALHLSYVRLFIDSGRTTEQDAFSYFLILIAILSSATAWHGIRVLRFKRRKQRLSHPVDLGVSLLLFVSSIVTIIYGFNVGVALVSYFPIIGVILGGLQLYYWLTPPRERLHWVFEHVGGMIGCSISTITAFTVFGAPSLLNVESLSMIMWFLPSIILVPLIFIFNYSYKQKFSKKVST